MDDLRKNLIQQLRFLLWISIGSIPAALIRWQIDNYFFANILGCFVLGIFIGLNFNFRYQLMLCSGFCGSLTTFSGWMVVLKDYLNRKDFSTLFSSIGLPFAFGLGAIFLGFSIGKLITLPKHFRSHS